MPPAAEHPQKIPGRERRQGRAAERAEGKFGIDLVFFGRKDAPYGYMIVDHVHRTVINGARVLATEQLLDFATPEQRFARIEDYIDRLLTLNPKITQSEIFQKLKKQRAYIKKGVIYFDGQTRPLKPFMAEAIDRNNRIRFIEMFHPATGMKFSMTRTSFPCGVPFMRKASSSARKRAWHMPSTLTGTS